MNQVLSIEVIHISTKKTTFISLSKYMVGRTATHFDESAFSQEILDYTYWSLL